MPSPIILTEQENRFCQSIFMEMYQDYRLRSMEPDLLKSLVEAFETWPAALNFTEQQNRRVQWQLERFQEIMKPYPYPYYPTTFGQDTRQLEVVNSIMVKIKAAL